MRRVLVVVAGACLCLCAGSARVLADTGTSLGDSSGKGADPLSELAKAPDANPFSGAAGMSVPILIPPGRKAATPDVRLAYSSYGGDSPFGYGWDVPLGRIERSAKRGVPRCGSGASQDFVLLLPSGTVELVAVSANVYRVRIDEAFSEAIADPANNRWEVRDRAGTTYRFGWAASARAHSGADVFYQAQPCHFTAVWALTQVADPNGNTIDIEYTNHSNTLYPAAIRYGGNAAAGVGHAFELRFPLDAAPRTVPARSYGRGIDEQMHRLVDRIEVYARAEEAAALALVRSYELEYEEDAETGRPLLVSVAGDLLPQQTFEYASSRNDLALSETYSYTPPPGMTRLLRETDDEGTVWRTLMDMTGDGLVDHVVAGTSWVVYPGLAGGGFGPAIPWRTPSNFRVVAMRDMNDDDEVLFETVDLTGDGVPDLVDARTTPWVVYPGRCLSASLCQFDAGIPWSAPFRYVRADTGSGTRRTVRGLYDLDADGLADYVATGTSADATWAVYWNTGSGFAPAPDPGFSASGPLMTVRVDDEGDTSTLLDVFDMNGDSLPDLVDGSGTSVTYRPNTGRGFAAPIDLGVAPPIRDTQGGHTGLDYLDVNGDGLPDRVAAPACWRYWPNRAGHDFAPTPVFGPGCGAWIRFDDRESSETSTRIEAFDFDGDRILDHVDASNLPWRVSPGRLSLGGQLTAAPIKPLLLLRADNGVGGATELRYEPSSRFEHRGADGAPDLPFVTWVVTGVRRTDGLCDPGDPEDPFDPAQNPCIDAGHELSKTLEYEDGAYDSAEREFRGFARVAETDAVGNVRLLEFAQDLVRRGRLLLEETWAGDFSHLVRRQQYTWHTKTALGRTQVYLAEQRTEEFSFLYDASLTQCLSTRNEPPDDFGRVIVSCTSGCSASAPVAGQCSPTVEGQVDTLTGWANPTVGHQRERPQAVITRYWNAAGGVTSLGTKLFRYDGAPGAVDGLSLGHVEKGNLRYVHSQLDQGPTGAETSPVVRMRYDALGNVVETTDPLGNVSSSVYSTRYFSLYPIVERMPQTGAVTHETWFVTDLRYGKPSIIWDENGGLTHYSYDALGRVECVARPGETLDNCKVSGGPFTHTAEYYYGFGNPAATSFQGKLSFVNTRLREPDAPSGYLVSGTFVDGLGRKRFTRTDKVIGSYADLRTLVVGHTVYDAAGRVARVHAPYVQSGAIQEAPANAATTYDYRLNGSSLVDPLGRVHAKTLPDGQRWTTLYEGRRTRSIDVLANTTVVLEDDFGREVRRERWDGSTLATSAAYSYDGLGRVLTTTVGDDPSTTVRQTWDSLGRRIEIEDPDSGDGEPGIWRYGYDAAGNLVYEDDPLSGQHVQACYDGLQRIVRRCAYANGDGFVADACSTGCAGASKASFSYDSTAGGNKGRGRLTRVTDPSGGEEIFYDARGRITLHTKTISGVSATLEFEYNEADRLTRLTYPDGEVLEHAYDFSGNLVSLAGSFPGGTPRSYLAAAEYDAFGRPSMLLHGNEVREDLDYHGPAENFRLRSVLARHPTRGTHQNLRYGYDELGRVERIDDLRTPSGELSGTAAYEYDGIGRLEVVDWLADGGLSGAHDESFAYDPIGNLAVNRDGEVVYDADHPHQVASHAGTNYRFDVNGRRRFEGNAERETRYRYDVYGQLTEIDITHASGPIARRIVNHSYDHAGRRVLQGGSGGTVRAFSRYAEAGSDTLTKYYYAGDRAIAVWQAKLPTSLAASAGRPLDLTPPPWLPGALAAAIAVLLLGPGRREVRLGIGIGPARAGGAALLVVVTALPLGFLSGCKPNPLILHYHLDHLGSTQALSDENGFLERSVRYAAYGSVRSRADQAGAPVALSNVARHEFTGYQSETDSGLQYAGARYYDPALGQFLTHDPKRQFASPYAYGPWDPMNGVDPDGQEFISFLIGALISAVIAGAISAAVAAIQTGNLRIALESFARGFAIGFASAVAGVVVDIGLEAINSATLTMAVEYAEVGYHTYGVVEAARDGNPIGAVLSGLNAVSSAYGLTKNQSGQSTSSGVSGNAQTGDFQLAEGNIHGTRVDDLTGGEWTDIGKAAAGALGDIKDLNSEQFASKFGAEKMLKWAGGIEELAVNQDVMIRDLTVIMNSAVRNAIASNMEAVRSTAIESVLLAPLGFAGKLGKAAARGYRFAKYSHAGSTGVATVTCAIGAGCGVTHERRYVH